MMFQKYIEGKKINSYFAILSKIFLVRQIERGEILSTSFQQCFLGPQGISIRGRITQKHKLHLVDYIADKMQYTVVLVDVNIVSDERVTCSIHIFQIENCFMINCFFDCIHK